MMSAFLLLVALAGLLPSSARAETGVTESEILIGSCYAFDSNLSKYGIEQIKGAQAYIDEVNARGGILGRRIRLVSYDDHDNPDEAIACFRRLISDGVFAAAFFAGSSPAIKHVAMAESNKVPLLGVFAGAVFLNEPFKRYVINPRPNFRDETASFADHLWNDLGARRIGVIHQNDPLGAAYLQEFTLALRKFGSAPVAEAGFQRHSLDVDQAIATVRAANPDVVVMTGLYNSLAEVLKKSRAAGWNVRFVSDSKERTLISEAGKAAEGLITPGLYPSFDSDLPATNAYRRLLKKHLPEAKPNQVSLEGFIDASVLAEGLKRAGRDLTRERFIDAVESIRDWDAGLGPDFKMTFGPQRHKGLDRVYFTVVRDGKPARIADWKRLRK